MKALKYFQAIDDFATLEKVFKKAKLMCEPDLFGQSQHDINAVVSEYKIVKERLEKRSGKNQINLF